MKQDSDHTYTLTVHVHNRPGVLVRVAQTFARRGHNIESLNVSADEDSKEFSLITITAFGQKDRIHQIVEQTAKLIDVLKVTVHKE